VRLVTSILMMHLIVFGVAVSSARGAVAVEVRAPWRTLDGAGCVGFLGVECQGDYPSSCSSQSLNFAVSRGVEGPGDYVIGVWAWRATWSAEAKGSFLIALAEGQQAVIEVDPLSCIEAGTLTGWITYRDLPGAKSVGEDLREDIRGVASSRLETGQGVGSRAAGTMRVGLRVAMWMVVGFVCVIGFLVVRRVVFHG